MTVTDTELQAFCDAVSEKIARNLGDDPSYFKPGDNYMSYAQRVHGHKPATFERGPKYARIVANAHQSRVFCFVDLENGNILKAAGWKSPEPKKHVRGNIKNGAADVTPYGARYR